MIGIFGGSFNPVHVGHLLLAEFIREEFKLDKIIFIPAKKPPHKNSDELSMPYHRYKMVELAISNNHFLEISPIELNRKGISYTSDTLEELSRKYPNEELSFICGSDSIIQLSSWHDTDKIFALSNIIIANRPNVSEIELNKMICKFKKQYNAKIFCSKAPHIEISSSKIRDRINSDLSIRYMVEESVLEYIKANKLYQGDDNDN